MTSDILIWSENRHFNLPVECERAHDVMYLLDRRVAWSTAASLRVFHLRHRNSRSICRRNTTVCMEIPFGVASTRVRRLTENSEDKKDGTCVLYWMNSAVRESFNHSLEVAAFTASNRKLPLVALYVLDVTYPDWSERHFQFAAEGLLDVRAKLADRGVPLAILKVNDAETVGSTVADLAVSSNAVRVIADAPLPLHRERIWMNNAVDGCENNRVPLIQVETNVVVPIHEVTDKDEYAARTIRPKIHRKWDSYFERLPKCEVKHQLKAWPQNSLDGHEKWDCDSGSLSDICRRAPEVSRFFKGGYDAAYETMEVFVQKKLHNYAEGRNEPANRFQSNLSPYLRYGHISPVEIALKVLAQKSGGSALKAGKDSFIEEMIVRRELAYNFCTFNENYHNMKGLPNYAQITLREHASDKRPWNYTYEQLEMAKTHDPYWNAAQLELLVTGKMQGYMRMYWAKKILEWTDAPAKALEYGLRLNNVYNLDGSDPNSYAGVMWCLGKHDQGWREREIFGKVRYMNDAGLKRKFNMQKYIDYADRLAKKHMASEMTKMRGSSLAKRPKQASITSMTQTKKKRRKLDS